MLAVPISGVFGLGYEVEIGAIAIFVLLLIFNAGKLTQAITHISKAVDRHEEDISDHGDRLTRVEEHLGGPMPRKPRRLHQ